MQTILNPCVEVDQNGGQIEGILVGLELDGQVGALVARGEEDAAIEGGG